jgi:hypothetical protein
MDGAVNIKQESGQNVTAINLQQVVRQVISLLLHREKQNTLQPQIETYIPQTVSRLHLSSVRQIEMCAPFGPGIEVSLNSSAFRSNRPRSIFTAYDFKENELQQLIAWLKQEPDKDGNYYLAMPFFDTDFIKIDRLQAREILRNVENLKTQYPSYFTESGVFAPQHLKNYPPIRRLHVIPLKQHQLDWIP